MKTQNHSPKKGKREARDDMAYRLFSGAKLDTLMEKHGWDDRKLASLLDTITPDGMRPSVASVRAWRQGKNSPNANYFWAMLQLFGIEKEPEKLMESRAA